MYCYSYKKLSAVTRREKIGLTYTKYIPSHYYTYLTFSTRYTSYVNFLKFPIVCFTSNKSFTDKLCLSTRLWNFKVRKSGQILCAHKPYFLMPGHSATVYLHNMAFIAGPEPEILPSPDHEYIHITTYTQIRIITSMQCMSQVN